MNPSEPMPTPLELLAPAGSTDIGIAAIDHGADAVYIGAPKFSARANAGNSLEEIERLVKHSHLYHAKVYVALNTILSDPELVEAHRLIQSVYNIGVDGLIIQDVGLLELDLPPIPLIASTQMHNSTPEKVKFLEAVGFQRVILARELSLAEISEIRRQTHHVALESFVHGALCVSYSGQCYMSQAVAKRSGNRGVCAQPCRSRYTLTDGDGNVILRDKFLLSLKDLNLSNDIADLVSAGITSFKIEGRYKDIDYVKNITAAYRQVIDRFLSDHPAFCQASSGRSRYTFCPDPSRTFNRGYTRYFIDGGKDKMASFDTRKSIGRYIGTISAVGKHDFRMDHHDLRNGDGLCFFTSKNKLIGFRVDRVEKEAIFPNTMEGLVVGTRLYRNHDHGFSRLLNKTSASRQIDVTMTFTQDEKGIRLYVKDEDGISAEHFIDTVFVPATDPNQAAKRIRTQLSSTGNTPYRVTEIRLTPAVQGFLTVGTVNRLRRDSLEALTAERLGRHPRQMIQITPNAVPYPEKELDYRANVLNQKAREFFVRHGAKVTEPAFETLAETSGRTLMMTRYCLRHELNACLKHNREGNALTAPLRISDGNHVHRLEFECAECCMYVVMEGQRHGARFPSQAKKGANMRSLKKQLKP